MVGRGKRHDGATELGYEEFWGEAVFEEYPAVLVATACVSFSASVGPTNFTAWDAQGGADTENICGICAYFASTYKANIDKLLRKVEIGENNEDVTL